MRDSTHISLQAILTTLQALAIVAGGCWVLFRYFEHERSAEELRAKQLLLQNQSSEIALLTQQTAARLAVEQQTLANLHGSLDLAIATEQRKLRSEELSKAVELQRLDLKLKTLQQTKSTHENNYAGAYRFDQEWILTGTRRERTSGDETEYELEYGFNFKNTSEIPFEMSLFVLDYYLGVPDPSNSAAIAILGTPEDRWNPGSTQPGAIRWRKIGSLGSVYAVAAGSIAYPGSDIIRNEHLRIGGGGVGALKPNQTFQFIDNYLVRAPSRAYIAFVMSYCFNRCKNNDDFYSRADWISLSSLKAPDLRTPASGIQAAATTSQ
jgi:hypothetical protein